VGHIVAIDFDRIDLTNLPRIVGATRLDALALLTERRSPWLRRLGQRHARHKVQVARRVARHANPAIRYDAVVGNVLDAETARRLIDADFIFLASDSIQSRLVFNALVHQYVIPGAQVGVKVRVDSRTGQVGDITVASRAVLPGPASGCLVCHELIPPARLQDEALSAGERRAQRYVESEDVAEPSVITLNALSAAQAATDLMMMVTGLFAEGTTLPHLVAFVRERTQHPIAPVASATCPDCSDAPTSRHARGDRARLPCRGEGSRRGYYNSATGAC
jgi:molybdopterin/thiamine biosynthesis adenylyltransferase